MNSRDPPWTVPIGNFNGDVHADYGEKSTPTPEIWNSMARAASRTQIDLGIAPTSLQIAGTGNFDGEDMSGII